MTDETQPDSFAENVRLLGETNVLLRELVDSTNSATKLVDLERSERQDESKTTRRLLAGAILAIVVLVVTVVMVGGRIIYGEIQQAKIPCSVRVQSRADTRAMGVRLVDGLAAKNPRFSAAERRQVHDLSVQITRDALPAPDC